MCNQRWLGHHVGREGMVKVFFEYRDINEVWQDFLKHLLVPSE